MISGRISGCAFFLQLSLNLQLHIFKSFLTYRWPFSLPWSISATFLIFSTALLDLFFSHLNSWLRFLYFTCAIHYNSWLVFFFNPLLYSKITKLFYYTFSKIVLFSGGRFYFHAQYRLLFQFFLLCFRATICSSGDTRQKCYN